MTYAEIRDSLQALTKEQREVLALDLKALALLDDPEYRTEITRRLDRGEDGCVTSEELARILAERRGRAAWMPSAHTLTDNALLALLFIAPTAHRRLHLIDIRQL